jgi:hypothetical protein
MSKTTSTTKARTIIGCLVETKNKVDSALMKFQQTKGKKVTYDEFLLSLLKKRN